MIRQKRKYIYINNLNPDGAVFQTQILDWLNIYKANNLEFCLIQAFHIKEFQRIKNLRQQVEYLRKCTELFERVIYLAPSRNVYYLANALLIYFKLFKYLYRYSEVLIFSRALIGKEIAFLKKISPARIIFYFDARAASAEENRYIAINERNFTTMAFRTISNVSYLEYKTLYSADKIFTVSNILRNYFQQVYNMVDKKFVYYPCLSDSKKFYLSSELRTAVRNRLKINQHTKLFIYSGGIRSSWQMSGGIFSFFRQLLKFDKGSMVLFLTKDIPEINKLIADFPETKSNILAFYVPNAEVCGYLNAADFGILFRENTIMNNVASPTKFAEYILCGLPVLISEGVGDYSHYTVENNLGLLIKESELKDPKRLDFNNIFNENFNRKHIAEIGERNFSKASVINSLIEEFKD